MLQNPLTLYKLIVLYMLNKVSFPLTKAQISEFILEKEYTNFLTLQQVINELTEANMIDSHTVRNRTLLNITQEGTETLQYFENHINETIKKEIHNYLTQKEYSLREEISVLGDYYKATSGEYEAHLIAKEHDITLIDLTLSVPSQKMAATICENWQTKNQEIYQYIIEQLF